MLSEAQLKCVDVYGPYLNAPSEVRQLFIDIESLERQIKKGTDEGKDKRELTAWWMDVVTRKDMYKKAVGLPFDPPIDLSRAERHAVCKLFHELKGFTWCKHFGWTGHAETLSRSEVKTYEASPAVYDGVTVHKKEENATSMSVKGIDFSGFGCEGSMPDALCVLGSCEFIRLNNNLISGTLPRNLGSLRMIQKLELSGNLLEGNLSSDLLSSLSELRHLDLSFNEFTGVIPDVFESVPHIEHINLAGNKFEGPIPSSLRILSHLEYLNLSCNILSGDIPEDFSGGMTALRHVNLSQNRFTKGINSFNVSPNLEILQLNNNQFKGRMADSVALLQKLDILYIQNNQLSGLVNPAICHLRKLRRLNMSNNNFRGMLPEDIGQLVNLESFLLTNNAVIGPVPLSIANLKKLRDFHIFRPYPSENMAEPKAFDRYAFQRKFEFAPSLGIDCMNWDYEKVYGRKRNPTDDETVTIFSGKL